MPDAGTRKAQIRQTYQYAKRHRFVAIYHFPKDKGADDADGNGQKKAVPSPKTGSVYFMKRNNVVDTAKGIGIIFVVIGHLNHFFDYESIVLTMIYSFHMPLFLFLSGFVFNYHPEVTSKEYCYRRFAQLVKPYFVFAIITFFYGFSTGQNDANGIYGIFFGNGVENHLNFNIALWFLPMLFCCNVIFYFGVKFSRQIKNERFSYGALTLFCIISAMAGYFLILRQKRVLWGIETALFSQIFMLSGYMSKMISDKLNHEKRNRKIVILACPVIAVLWGTGAKYNGRVDMNAGRYGNLYLFFGVAACGIFLIWQISCFVSKWKGVGAILNMLGRDSLYIMAYHIPATYIMYNVVITVMPSVIRDNVWKTNAIGISYIVIGDICIALLMKLLHTCNQNSKAAV